MYKDPYYMGSDNTIKNSCLDRVWRIYSPVSFTWIIGAIWLAQLVHKMSGYRFKSGVIRVPKGIIKGSSILTRVVNYPLVNWLNG